jgi:hypothetical protein
MLTDPGRWGEAVGLLSSPPFTKPDFKRLFNAYSDGILSSGAETDRLGLALGFGGTSPGVRSRGKDLHHHHLLLLLLLLLLNNHQHPPVPHPRCLPQTASSSSSS